MRAMLVTFHDEFWLEVARGLSRGGLEVAGILTCIPKRFRQVRQFRGAKIIDSLPFKDYRFVLGLNRQTNEALSEEVLAEAYTTEREFLDISDRLAYLPVPVVKRKKVFADLLLFWRTFFRSLEIEAVIFPHTPHMGNENVIYEAARGLKLKMIFAQETLINNRMRLRSDYHAVPKIPRAYLKGYSTKAIANQINRGLYQDFSASSIWLRCSREFNASILDASVHRKGQLKILRKIFSLYVFRGIYLYLKHFFSIPKMGIFFFNGAPRGIIPRLFPLFLLQARWRSRGLRKFYASCVTSADYRRKYVYFALHLQPERTTMPEGGFFGDQLLAIDLLAKALPAGWRLYVKEHPCQFESGDLRHRHFRDKDDYRKMLTYPNVRLIRAEENSEKLVKGSVCTATITGSTGWEGLVQGKACLVFAAPWYAPCQSCFVVKSLADCHAAFQEIKSKTPAEIRRDVWRFLAYFQDELIVSSVDHVFANRSEIANETLADNMATGILKKLKIGSRRN